MKRLLPVAAAVLAGALALPAGCTFHHSPIKKWYFYDIRTGEPINNVLLLEWTEKDLSRRHEAQAFEQQVPDRKALEALRSAMITLANPDFESNLTTKVHFPVTVTQRSRHMAIHPAYGYYVKFASQELLAKLGVEAANDPSVAYILLTHETDAATAADWLHWLSNGRLVLQQFNWRDRKRVYEAFGAYWDRTAEERGLDVASELAVRPPGLAAELARIYRDELDRTPPKLPAGG